jgi:hypothetical protein
LRRVGANRLAGGVQVNAGEIAAAVGGVRLAMRRVRTRTRGTNGA